MSIWKPVASIAFFSFLLNHSLLLAGKFGTQEAADICSHGSSMVSDNGSEQSAIQLQPTVEPAQYPDVDMLEGLEGIDLPGDGQEFSCIPWLLGGIFNDPNMWLNTRLEDAGIMDTTPSGEQAMKYLDEANLNVETFVNTDLNTLVNFVEEMNEDPVLDNEAEHVVENGQEAAADNLANHQEEISALMDMDEDRQIACILDGFDIVEHHSNLLDADDSLGLLVRPQDAEGDFVMVPGFSTAAQSLVGQAPCSR